MRFPSDFVLPEDVGFCLHLCAERIPHKQQRTKLRGWLTYLGPQAYHIGERFNVNRHAGEHSGYVRNGVWTLSVHDTYYEARRKAEWIAEVTAHDGPQRWACQDIVYGRKKDSILRLWDRWGFDGDYSTY